MAQVKVMNSPSAERNKEPILQVLKTVLPTQAGLYVLEIASGTGQHHIHFAQNLPSTTWQPSECDAASINSISAYQAVNANLKNVKPPVYVDCCTPVAGWAAGNLTPATFDAILCVNMIHISPWVTTEGLFSGAANYLKPDGLLFTYGPYKINGIITPESNVRFDESLKNRNPSWGLRDIDEVRVLAEKNGFTYDKMFDMPANNKMLVFTKR